MSCTKSTGVQHEVWSLGLELPCGEPVEMVYGGVSLPGIAFGARHPVHQRGEKVESVAHGANDQAWNAKNYHVYIQHVPDWPNMIFISSPSTTYSFHFYEAIKESMLR